jgi:hypothetical protein
MHSNVSQADELPIDDPVFLLMSPRTGHGDIDGSHALQLVDQDSLANDSELTTTPLEATMTSMAVTALLLSSPRNINVAREMQLPEQDSQTGDVELAVTPIKATLVTVAVEALPLSSGRRRCPRTATGRPRLHGGWYRAGHDSARSHSDEHGSRGYAAVRITM